MADDRDCGCPDFDLSRRSFLRRTSGVVATGEAAATLPDMHRSIALGGPGDAGNILIVLSLRAGWTACRWSSRTGTRPTLRRGQTSPSRPAGCWPLTGCSACTRHSPLLPLWVSGKFAAVHAVGLPVPNRSHFSAMEEVEDADPGSQVRSGWINRLIGLDAWASPLEGVQIGSGIVPTSLYGSAPVLAMGSLSDTRLAGSGDAAARRRRKAALQGQWYAARGPLKRGVTLALTTVDAIEAITAARLPPQGSAVYPSTSLGRAPCGHGRTGPRGRRRQSGPPRSQQLGPPRQPGHFRLRLLQAPDRRSRRIAGRVLPGSRGRCGPRHSRHAERVRSATARERQRWTRPRLRWRHAGPGSGHPGGGQYVTRSWPGLAAGALVDGDLAVICDYRSVLSEPISARLALSPASLFPSFSPEPVGITAAA